MTRKKEGGSVLHELLTVYFSIPMFFKNACVASVTPTQIMCNFQVQKEYVF